MGASGRNIEIEMRKRHQPNWLSVHALQDNSQGLRRWRGRKKGPPLWPFLRACPVQKIPPFGNPRRLCRKFGYSTVAGSAQACIPAYHCLTKGFALKLTEWEHVKTQMAVRTAAKKERGRVDANPVNGPATRVPKASSADGVSSFQFQCLPEAPKFLDRNVDCCEY